MDSADRNPRWNYTNEDLTEVGDYDSAIKSDTLVAGIDDRKPPGFFESLDKARATDAELESMVGNDVLGLDKNSGLHTCPSCKKISNPPCRHTFHNPYRGDDPFDFNPESDK